MEIANLTGLGQGLLILSVAVCLAVMAREALGGNDDE